ncbi:MAG: aminomethyl-transferring glycine dehydrogenase subunit GcvPA [Spirochaetia bacterium]
MSFVSNTPQEQKEMLDAIGLTSTSDLFLDIPEAVRNPDLDIPKALSESEVYAKLHALSHKNAHGLTCFLGAGYYDHFIPAAIDSLVSRSEFYTAYTPYQPEASQGTLQAIYEYQSLICRLTGMDAANASLYDGGTALFEAAMMAIRVTRRNTILIDSGVSPIYRNMLYCYTRNLSINFIETPVKHGQSDREDIQKHMDSDTAAVITANPNFFGAVDDFSDIAKMAHENGSLLITSVYPISLGVLKTPEAMGADIVTGEGQSLGIPLSFGGPYLGFLASKKKYLRKMPGRIAGATVDTAGKRGFVLTLQAREQHIRREKAMSNICTNQALCALRATIYMSLMGKQGLKEAAMKSAAKAEYLKDRIDEIPGAQVKRSAPTFNEFTVELRSPAGEVAARMIDKGIAAGFPLGRYYEGMDNYLLVAVTENRTIEELGMFLAALEASV